MGWVKDAVKAGKKAGGQVSDAWKDATGAAGDAAGDVADAVEEAFEQAGKVLVDAVNDAGKELMELWNDNMIGIRKLRPAERSILRRVYQGSLPPFDRMLIVSLSGISGRAFVLPASLVPVLLAPILPRVDLILLGLAIAGFKNPEHYLMFMGRRGYNDAIQKEYDNRPGDTLVHEAGHVWQGYQQGFTWSYVLESVYHQGCKGQAAYEYEPGKQWDRYNPEQQAKLVEDWFADGESETSDLYPYIKCNVRPGKPHAGTDFSSGTSSGATTGPSTTTAPAGMPRTVAAVRAPVLPRGIPRR